MRRWQYKIGIVLHKIESLLHATLANFVLIFVLDSNPFKIACMIQCQWPASLATQTTQGLGPKMVRDCESHLVMC